MIDTATLSDGVTNRTYSATIGARGGGGAYKWSAAAASLPPGILLNAATGQLVGTPTASGNYSFEVQALDSSGQSARKTLGIRVSDPLAIATPALVAATVGVPYTAQLTAVGGAAPLAWTLSQSVETGLKELNPATGQNRGNPNRCCN